MAVVGDPQAGVVLPAGTHWAQASEQCNVFVWYNDVGQLLGAFSGVFEFKLTEQAQVTFDCEGDVFLHMNAINQTQEKSSNEVFTTFDRPEPMSPEMQAIMRLAKKNELAREADRAEMEKRYAKLQAAYERSGERTETESEDVLEEPVTGDTPAELQDSADDDEPVQRPVDKPKRTRAKKGAEEASD